MIDYAGTISNDSTCIYNVCIICMACIAWHHRAQTYMGMLGNNSSTNITAGCRQHNLMVLACCCLAKEGHQSLPWKGLDIPLRRAALMPHGAQDTGCQGQETLFVEDAQSLGD